MIDYSGLSKEKLIEELHETDEDLFFLQDQLDACMRDHDEDLRAIHERQKREKDEFRILDRNTGELVILDELPVDLSNAVTIEHRRVTSWQGVSVSEEEDDEGN